MPPRRDVSALAVGSLRRQLTCLTLLVSLIAGACSSGESGSAGDPATTTDSTDFGEEPIAPVEETAWTRLMAQIGPVGEVSLEVALQAFALAIGPLPGVDTPEGEPGVIVSGTGPLRWVLHHWDELTPEQQSAVEAYLPSPDNLTAARGVDPGTDEPAAASSSGLSGVTRTLSYQAGSDPEECQYSEGIAQLLAQVKSAVETEFGRELVASVVACALPGYAGGPFAVAYNSEGELSAGTMVKCAIVLPEASLQDNVSTFQMTYVFFNCLQADLMSIDKWLQLPAWLGSGSAFWMASNTAYLPPEAVSALDPWLTQPGRPLFARAFDAAGFFSLMEDANVDPVTHIDQMLIGWVDAGNTAAYDVAALSEELLDEWGPGYFADQGKGDPWFFTGTGITAQANAAGDITVANGDKRAISSVSYTATPVVATLIADVVVFGAVGGPLGLVWEAQSSVKTTDALGLKRSSQAHMTFTYEPFLEDNGLAIPAPHGRVYLPDGSDKRLTEALGDAYCMLPEGCECPAGSPGEGRITIPGTDAFAYIGITGHTVDTDLIVEGLSLEAFCELDPQGRATYILTGGSWSTNFQGGLADNGCIWPSASGGGAFSYDPSAELEIDTSQSPPRYWPYARTNEQSGQVQLAECVVDEVRKYEASDVTVSVGGIWFGVFDDPWLPLTGDVVADSRSWGDPTNTASWTLTRLN